MSEKSEQFIEGIGLSNECLGAVMLSDVLDQYLLSPKNIDNKIQNNTKKARDWMANIELNKWVDVGAIPNDIFWSVWNIIESNSCLLKDNAPKFMIVKR